MADSPSRREAATEMTAELATALRRSDAVERLDGLAGPPPPPRNFPDDGAAVGDLVRLAAELRAAGRTREAAPLLERIVAARPGSAVAEHNLAAALGDLGRVHDSEAAALRAIAKGGAAPETWLVLGRALAGQGRLEEAEAALAFALELRPNDLGALRERAQLTWMRGGRVDELETAIAPLRRLAAGEPAAAVELCGILRVAVGDHAALDALAPWLNRPDPHPDVALAAVGAAVDVDPALALRLASSALRACGPRAEVVVALALCLLACDRPEAAAPALETHLEQYPADRVAQGLLDAAWRLLGDARALGAADYQAMVGCFPLRDDLDASAGAAWVEAVAQGLRALHPFVAHPFAQSLRGGAQSRLDPRGAGDPAIDDLFDRLSPVIDAWMGERAAALADGDPRTPGWRVSGAWSVRLAAGGRHLDHVHPGSWASGVVHIGLPPAAAGAAREGWLRFGAAPIGAGRTLPPLHWVKPRPGHLVLFPSWFWHGTEPFAGEGERLSLALNLDRGRGGEG